MLGNRSRLIILILCLLHGAGFLCLQAQPTLPPEAEDYYRNGEFSKAIPIYLVEFKKNQSPAPELWQRIADSYRRLHLPDSAQPYYEGLIRTGKYPRNAEKHLGQCLLQAGKIEEGRSWILKYLTTDPAEVEANHWIAMADSITDFLVVRSNWDIYELQINSPLTDFGPSWFPGGFIWSSQRPEWVQPGPSGNKNILNVFYAPVLSSPASKLPLYYQPAPLNKAANATFHEMAPQYDSLANLICFTRGPGDSAISILPPSQNTRYSIWFGKPGTSRWDSLVPFPWNSQHFSCMHPFFVHGEESLIFSSDMPGGFGGFDLYKTTRVMGGWTRPQNLGPKINSAANEISPWVHSSSHTLYYSSDSRPRTGFDLFFSPETGDLNWENPQPLGTPLNSPYNEYSIIFSPDLLEAYFASDRPGGMGGTDVYLARRRDWPVTCLQEKGYRLCYSFYESEIPIGDTIGFEFEWDMGDGTHFRGSKIEHCYSSPGRYTIQLKIKDLIMEREQMADPIPLEIEGSPQAVLEGPDTVFVGDTVHFSGKRSWLPQVLRPGYRWETGTGEEFPGENLTFVWNRPGFYEVRLRVSGFRKDGLGWEKACNYHPLLVMPKQSQIERGDD